MQNGDKGLPNIILASQGLLVKMPLNYMVYFNQMLHNNTF